MSKKNVAATRLWVPTRAEVPHATRTVQELAVVLSSWMLYQQLTWHYLKSLLQSRCAWHAVRLASFMVRVGTSIAGLDESNVKRLCEEGLVHR
jgi:hypothetical protein